MTALRRITDETDNEAPPFYDAIRFEFEEIIMGVADMLAKARDLKGAYEHRQTVSLSLAANDIATVGGQVSSLARHLCEMATKHVERTK